jgi:hypothetical protein
MDRDRTEMHDLAADQPDRVREMKSLWEQWAERTHATPWPWGKPYGEEKPRPKSKKAKPQEPKPQKAKPLAGLGPWLGDRRT